MSNIAGIGKILKTKGKIYLCLAKDFARTALCAPLLQRWITAVDWQIKNKRELPLKFRHREARHVRGLGIQDRIPDSFEYPRPLKELSRQGNRRRIIARHQRKASPRMQSGNAREEVEIIIDDGFGNWSAGDVDHARSRHAKKKQEAQHPLFIMMRTRDFGDHLLIKTKARHDEDGARPTGIIKKFSERSR